MSFFDLKWIPEAWNRFFHAETETWTSGAIRIGLGIILLINCAVFAADAPLWFTESGLLTEAEARTVIDPDTFTIFAWFANTPGKVAVYFCALFLSLALFILGFYARIQAAVIFLLLTSLQHRNLLLLDGEDTLMRLLCFFCIFLPLDHNFSVRAWWRSRNQSGQFPQTVPIWPLRLVQFQMTLLYFSTATLKLDGAEWLDGTSMYYVVRLDDLFGGALFPAALLDSLTFLKYLTWAVLAFEVLLPIGLWIRQTRKRFLLAAVLFHLGIDLSMHLFLFHWTMIIGLIAFLERTDLPGSAHRFIPARDT